jgi:hypothetical protein
MGGRKGNDERLMTEIDDTTYGLFVG